MPGKIRHAASLTHLPCAADDDFSAGRNHSSGSGGLFARGPAAGDLHFKAGTARLLNHLAHRETQKRWHAKLRGVGDDHCIRSRPRSRLRWLRRGLRRRGRGVAGLRAGIQASRRTCSLRGRRRGLRICGRLRTTQRIVAGQVVGGFVKGLNIFALRGGHGPQFDVVRHAEVFQNLLRHFSEDRCGDFGSVVCALG